MFYAESIHENCIRRMYFDAGKFARFFGDEGCLAHLGCKGFIAMSDCNKRGWNNNTNWCVKAGAPCMACSEPTFPDESAPFYGVFPLNNKRELDQSQLMLNNKEFVEPLTKKPA